METRKVFLLCSLLGLTACGNLPRGAIVGWYGGATIPEGFVICDGKGGVPDLIDKYPLGVAEKDADQVGKEDGGKTHSHTFALSSDQPRPERGGQPDGRGPHPGTGSPQTTGLDHTHRVIGSIGPANNKPLSTKIMYICKK